MKPYLVSIELTNYCSKACDFCYAQSTPRGGTFWRNSTLVPFLEDLAANGIDAVSFGGGEPLQYEGFWALLEEAREIPLFKSMTTNGLHLDSEAVRRLSEGLDKVHVSLHYPDRPQELQRVIQQVLELSRAGLRSGINFLVRGKNVEAEQAAVRAIKDAGIGSDRVVFLPLRGKGLGVDMPRFQQVAKIMSAQFQSMWCLLECQKSDRFVSVNWEGRVGWCSYTPAKTQMSEFTYDGMINALRSKDLVFCG